MTNAKKKTEALWARCSPKFRADMESAVRKENEMLGNYQERGLSEVIRELCEDYIKRIEAIAESETAKHAAKVLKGARRAG